MKVQSISDMLDVGATEDEAIHAMRLFQLLRPGLKIKSNGRIETQGGDKTVLGVYRYIGSVVFSD